MAKAKPTHYELLGVKPNVKHHELTFVYDRRMSALRREDAPPDQKAETAMRAAFDVLSDPDRREAYDRELAAARLKPSSGVKQGAVAVAFVVILAAGIGYYVTSRSNVEGVKGKPVEEITAHATSAVLRLQSVDMGGQSKAAGLAFAIDEGVMIASCDHIAPNTQLSVNVRSKLLPARLTMTDEQLGLCRIEAKGAGGWPLSVSPVEVRAGDMVYITQVNAVGEVLLKEARVKAVMPGKGGKQIDTTIPPAMSGAPLLDLQGRVVAMASQSRHVVIPVRWTEPPPVDTAPSQAPPAPAEAPAAPSPYDRGGVDPTAKGRTLPANSPISQEHAERLHKQYRPERKIPADQDP